MATTATTTPATTVVGTAKKKASVAKRAVKPVADASTADVMGFLAEAPADNNAITATTQTAPATSDSAITQRLTELLSQGSQPEAVKRMDYTEAQQQAMNRLNPQYENSAKNLRTSMDKDAVARGLFGQLPNEALQRYKQSELSNQKDADIADLAGSIISQTLNEDIALRGSERSDNEFAYNKAKDTLAMETDEERYQTDQQWKTDEWNKDETRYQTAEEKDNTRYATAETKDNERYATDQEWKTNEWNRDETRYKDAQAYQDAVFTWDKKIDTAKLTGYMDGSQTMDMQSLMHSISVDNQELAMKKKEMDASIAQGWASISASRSSGSSSKASDEQAYQSALYNKAVTMANTELARDPKYSMSGVPSNVLMTYTQKYLNALTGSSGSDLSKYGSGTTATVKGKTGTK